MQKIEKKLFDITGYIKNLKFKKRTIKLRWCGWAKEGFKKDCGI